MELPGRPATDERVIYLFGCNNAICRTRVGSWRAVRSVRTLKSKPTKNTKHDMSKTKAQATFEFKVDEDIWNTDDSFSGGFDDPFSGFDSPQKTEPQTENFSFSITEPIPHVQSVDVEQQDVNSLSKSPDSVPAISEALSCLSLDSAPQYQSSSRFPTFYIATEEEYIQTKSSKLAAYSEYISKYESITESEPRGNIRVEEWASESYEKINIKGYTKLLKKFIDVVEENPEQLLRYDSSRSENSLLPYSDWRITHHHDSTTSETKPHSSSVPICPRCNGRRVFEFQLMPALLSVLPTTQAPSCNSNSKGKNKVSKDLKKEDVVVMNGMDWGTVVVYSCENDCLPIADGRNEQGAFFSDEVVVVHLENNIM